MNTAITSAQMNDQFIRAGKACRVYQFGGPEAICFEPQDALQPGDGEVLVRVKAAGVGPWDGWIRAGKSALPQPLPLTLGSDLAGVVEAVGPNVDTFARGDTVFGVTNPQFTGSYADYAIATAAMIARKPASISDVDAASVPVIAVTAWQALFEQAAALRGQTVLIHGAAGNVGAFAVQFAVQAGIRVVATCAQQDLSFVRGLGAHEVLIREGAPFETLVRDVDAVIDLVGGDVQTRSFAVLKPGGALISAVSQPDQDLTGGRGVKATFFLVSVTTKRLQTIARMMAAGSLVTSVGTVLPLSEARTAHEMLDGIRPKARGKIVLLVAD
jgi:NADPH:quinone reductase-like Zn-dependent oxidoreductase